MNATQVGHVGLLHWAFAELFPAISAPQREGMLRQAAQLAAPLSQREVECGFELHHDLSGRVDFGFHCQAQQLDASAATLPSWWQSLTAASNGPLRFQSRHWLEFDQAAEGPVRLAGLFQHCDTDDRRDLRAFDALLAHFTRVGCFPGQPLQTSRALRAFFEMFGVPFQWGVMVGRPEGLKVVAMLDGVDAARLHSFFEAEGLAADARLLASPPEGMQLAISLDVNLARDGFGPTVGVEVTGPARAMPIAQWHGLPGMLEALGVDREQRAAMEHALSPLPRGQRLHSGFQGFEEFLPDALRTATRFASLNHLKLAFRAGRPAALKSYVSLKEVKGEQFNRSSTQTRSAHVAGSL